MRINELRFGARTLLRDPGFALVVILALAVGMGAHVAIFSPIYSRLLGIPRFHNPGKLARVLEQSSVRSLNQVLPATYPDWKSRNQVFGDSAAVAGLFSMTFNGSGKPEVLVAGAVTANFFQRIGVQPTIGRAFVAGEDTRGHDHVVILSHQLWRRCFAGNEEMVGESITLNGEAHKVIGVLPPDFTWNARQADVWIPYAIHADGGDRPAVGPFMRVAAKGMVKVGPMALRYE